MIERISDLHGDDNTNESNALLQENGLPDTPDFRVENTFDDEQHEALKARIRDALVFAATKFEVFHVDEENPPIHSNEAFDATYEEGKREFLKRFPQADDRIIRDLALMDLGMSLGEALIPVFMLWQMEPETMVDTVKTIHPEENIDKEWVAAGISEMADHLDRCSELMTKLKGDDPA